MVAHRQAQARSGDADGRKHRDIEGLDGAETAAALGLTYPIVLQRQWEISLLYATFATPIGYLIDEQGILASDVAVGVGPILALANVVASPRERTDFPLESRLQPAN